MFSLIKNAFKTPSFTRYVGQRLYSQHAVKLESTTPEKEKRYSPAFATETSMTPKKIVEYLDSYIIGQKDAKKSMAIALSNINEKCHIISPRK